MSSSKKPIRALAISDLHLGVNRLSPNRMYRSLFTELSVRLTKDIDYCFVTGDVYDRQLRTDSLESKTANQFCSFLCSACARNQIILIVLNGTTNHDGNQSENFVHINAGLSEPCELYYWDKVKVHNINGITFLSVPDNAASTHAGVQEKVSAALREAGVDKVDISLTHGLYDSHMLAGFGLEAHSAEFYLSITRTLIVNGHIHTTSRHEHLRTVGSYDCHRQGEEEAKGGWEFVIDTEKCTFEETFFENRTAYQFKRFDISESIEDIGEAYEFVTKKLSEFKILPTCYITLGYVGKLDMSALLERLNDNYRGDVVFSTTKKKPPKHQFEEDDTELMDLSFLVKDVTPITPETHCELISDWMLRNGTQYDIKHETMLEELMDG